MADALGDLLGLGADGADPMHLTYLSQLAEQTTDSLKSTESSQLTHSSQSLLLSLQSLSKKSHKSVVTSAASHALLRKTIPTLARSTTDLSQAVPKLDSQAESFSTAFSKSSENSALTRRKEALKLLANSERLVDVMELPPLLSSAVATPPVNYSSALDLYDHIRRLASLYPSSPLVNSVMGDADIAIHHMTADLVSALKAPNLKLAAALRTVGWMKRVIPTLISDARPEDSLPALFLVCRVATLITLLEALEPLRALANEEWSRKNQAAQTWSGGQQTERYLKRFIEIFREHSFSISSVFKNINSSLASAEATADEALRPLPPALTTLPLHLVELLLDTLRTYLPCVKDQASRESILTQVLYCSGSLGRLGADFGMLLATIGMDEWVDIIKKHRLLAGRLESVIGGFNRSQEVTTN